MPKDDVQKFMIKLDRDLHRELMAYAGVRGEPLSDIIVEWIREKWAEQPERKTIAKLIAKRDEEGQSAVAA
jgi:hypothetical protein